MSVRAAAEGGWTIGEGALVGEGGGVGGGVRDGVMAVARPGVGRALWRMPGGPVAGARTRRAQCW